MLLLGQQPKSDAVPNPNRKRKRQKRKGKREDVEEYDHFLDNIIAENNLFKEKLDKENNK